MKRVFQRGLMLALLVSGVLQASFGEASQGQKAAAEQLLALLNIQQQSEQMIDQLVKNQIEKNPNFAPFEKILRSFYGKYLSYAALKEDMVRTYTDEFSQKELQDIIAFYQSPTGRKVISRLPIIMRKGSEIGMQKVKEHQDELRAQISAEAAKYKAKGAASAGSPAGK